MHEFDFFEFDGRPSTDFGVMVFSRSQYEDPEPNESEVQIPGMNGVLHFWDGTFSEVSISYSVMIRGDDPLFIREQMERFRSWLLSKRKYCRLEDTLNPNYYRMGIYKGRSEVRYSGNEKMGKMEIEFQCKPQKFLKVGDTAISITSSPVTLYNPTDFSSKPLIRAFGVAGSVTIDSVTISLTGVSGHADIDCETEEVPGYKSKTTLQNGKFIQIPAGFSQVSFTGFTKLEIYPRWWTI